MITIQTTKQIKETTEIDLIKPRYIVFFKSMFFKFMEVDSKLHITHLFIDAKSLEIRDYMGEIDKDAWELQPNYIETTEEAFNVALHDFLRINQLT